MAEETRLVRVEERLRIKIGRKIRVQRCLASDSRVACRLATCVCRHDDISGM